MSTLNVSRRRPRRVWVKMMGRTPTSFHVGSNDLIDDLKYMITTKFPNSIKSHYDAADLVIKIPLTSGGSPKHNTTFRKQQENVPVQAPSPLYPNANSNSLLKSSILPVIPQSSPIGGANMPSANNSSFDLTGNRPSSSNSHQENQKSMYLELQPDLYVWNVMDTYFADGQSMQNAFVIDISDELLKEREREDKRIQEQQQLLFQQQQQQQQLLPLTSTQHFRQQSNELSLRSQPMNGSFSDISNNAHNLPPQLGISAPLPTPSNNSKSHLSGSLNSSNSKIGIHARNKSDLRESTLSPFETPTHNPISKMAILGDSKVPPPRFKNQSISDIIQSSNSAIIMFPNDNKSLTNKKHSHKQSASISSFPLKAPPNANGDLNDLRKTGLKINTNSSNEELNTNKKLDNTHQGDEKSIPIQLSISAPTPSIISPPNNVLSATSSTSNTSNATSVTPTIGTLNNSSNTTLKNISSPLNPITEGIKRSLNKNDGDNIKNDANKMVITKSKLDHRIHALTGVAKILNHLNVLVVEDNLVNQRIMARHLKSCNVQYDIAKTGKEALEKWKQGGFHLCFMDIQLPVMSGIEVTKEIRRLERLHRIGQFAMGGSKRHSQDNIDNDTDNDMDISIDDINDHLDLSLFRSPLIIVALTASSSVADQQDALAAGCNDFLTKPVQLKWLKNKLTEWGCMQALINFDYFRDGQ